MRNALEMITLEDLGIVGCAALTPSASAGQLFDDCGATQPGQSLLAGYHNPQGRANRPASLVQWTRRHPGSRTARARRCGNEPAQ